MGRIHWAGLVVGVAAAVLFAGCTERRAADGNEAGAADDGHRRSAAEGHRGTSADLAKPKETGVLFRSMVVDGEERKYAVYVPRGYDADKEWPLVVFLHGRGECGLDGQRQVTVGLGPAVLNAPWDWPVVAVFPQIPMGKAWVGQEELVRAVVAEAEREWRIDPKRRYLTGLSLGGAGTWDIASRTPEMWAAIVPICGYKAGDAAALAGIPAWCFHGEKDSIIPVSHAHEMAEAIRAAGGSVELTIYPDLDHNSWDRAYRESGVAKWMLGTRRP